ncbi:MAG: hypothetical protein JW990_19350 [Thermoleophilia bacterium]|nr:hypothetical protein [Thermoleophilia bacterium]
MKHTRPVGAPPAALVLHTSQMLDANEWAHESANNAEEMIAEFDRYMEDQVFTRTEQRKHRERMVRSLRLANGLCSIIKWAWASLIQIEKLTAEYRARTQETAKAAPNAALTQPDPQRILSRSK